MARSNEAFWWSLFSAGGVTSALFVPVLVVVTGLALPFFGGDDPAALYERVYGWASMWMVRIALLGIIGLSFFHCAHRIRHILLDVGLRAARSALMVLCYGAAGVGTGVAGVLLLTL